MSTLTDHRPAPARFSTPAAVQLSDLVKAFGAVTAVDHLSLTIQPAEVVALLGPNGAGKSSTIDMLLGLSRPDAGTVTIGGRPPEDAVRRGLVSAVLQTGGLLRDLTVAETVRLTAALYPPGRPPDEVLHRAGITEIANRRVGSCSGGEQQRLRFALALIADPDVLVLDEPTTGMDVESRRAFWATIRTDADAGRTVLFATHYLAEADEYADRIVMVRRGRIVADGTPSQIKALGNGRVVRATVPGGRSADLGGLPGTASMVWRGDTLTVRAADSDAVVRHLLTATQAYDVEVTTNNLEDAFVALTNDEGGPS